MGIVNTGKSEQASEHWLNVGCSGSSFEEM
jgi:hypothetical protein